jgi:hypothetical protein
LAESVEKSRVGRHTLRSGIYTGNKVLRDEPSIGRLQDGNLEQNASERVRGRDGDFQATPKKGRDNKEILQSRRIR